MIWFSWGTTIICLLGTVLNVKKISLCFYFWSVGNIAWLIYDINCRLYSRALLDIVQLALALWGIYEWQFKKTKK